MTQPGESPRIRTAQCPKRWYTTLERAERALRQIAKAPREKFPTRAYRCPRCGWWHLTSQPKAPMKET